MKRFIILLWSLLALGLVSCTISIPAGDNTGTNTDETVVTPTEPTDTSASEEQTSEAPVADDESSDEDEASVDERAALLTGTWESSYGEVYTIDVAAGTFDAGSTSYAGDNMEISFDADSDAAGYIYFKYTRAFCLEHSDFDQYVYTYDTDAPDVGKWYAVRFEGLIDFSVKLSGAYGTKSSTDTLEEAKTEFTVENGYFAAFSNCDSSRSVLASLLFFKK